jgi:transcriptional regulator with XRE-family HTH domain
MKKRTRTIEGDREGTEAEIRREVGRRIAEMRRKLRLSARRVAEVLEISREAVTHIETGRNNINAVALWKLATLFHCRVNDFFPEVPDGYALTRADTQKIEQVAGETALRWAEELFGEPAK